MDREITHSMHIAIISDTHMPKGKRKLSDACVEHLKAADLIVHGGDLTTRAILDELSSYSKVIAVSGNVDDRELQRTLPETADFEVEGARLAVIHDAGPSKGRLPRLRKRFPDADAVIFGHSHLPLHEIAVDGFQIFNPGSPTERRRAPYPTMGIAHATRGRLSFELVRVG